MQMISLILACLALLAAVSSLILTLWERKRGKARRASMLQYADIAAKNVASELVLQVNEGVHSVESQIEPILERVKALEGGVVPDYEQAKAAASAVNDFNQGITNILNFEPMDVLRKGRNQEVM